MSPRPRLQPTQWADDSLRVEVKQASVVDEPANQQVFAACLAELNEVKLRLSIACYGPGTEESPKAKFYFLLGESAAVHCRGLEEVAWFREELAKWLKSLDGIRLEKADGTDEMGNNK